MYAVMPGTLPHGGRALMRMILLKDQPRYEPMWLNFLDLTGDAETIKRKNEKLYSEMVSIAYLVKQYTKTTLDARHLCDLLAKVLYLSTDKSLLTVTDLYQLLHSQRRFR